MATCDNNHTCLPRARETELFAGLCASPLELLPSWTISIWGKLAFLALEDVWMSAIKSHAPYVRYVASHRVCGIRIARHRVWQDYREQNDCTPVAANVGFPSKQRRENLWHAAAVAGKLRRPTKQPLNLLNYWTILPHPLSSDTLHCINTVTLAILIWTIMQTCKLF